MNGREERRRNRGEGWLIVLCIALVAALFLYSHLKCICCWERVEAIHDVSGEALYLAYMKNINTAGAQELSVLPGIGDELAVRIVKYREENGPFGTIEEIMDVPGIGEGRFAEMRDRIFTGQFDGEGF